LTGAKSKGDFNMKTYFSASKAPGATLQLALPAKSNFQRIITWLKATNDKASTTLSFHKTKIIKTTNTASAAGQKVMTCLATAGIVANDIVIIQDSVDPALYEIGVVASVIANTSITMTNNLTNTYSAGAKIHGCVIAGGTTAAEMVLDVGVATISESNETAVFVADKNEAIYITHSAATATCNMYMSGFLRS